MVRVEVADNGPGVPREIAKRIFDPFFTTKPQGVGTGVGLSVCHGILAAHDGDIGLGSQDGPGAVFVLRLPRSAAAADAPPPDDAAPAWRHGRILVVDDEPDIAQLLTDVLERDGHEVARALSGGEALARLAGRRGRPDPLRPAHAGHGRPGALPRAGPRAPGARRGASCSSPATRSPPTSRASSARPASQVIEKPIDPGDLSRKVQILLADGAAPGLTSSRIREYFSDMETSPRG